MERLIEWQLNFKRISFVVVVTGAFLSLFFYSKDISQALWVSHYTAANLIQKILQGRNNVSQSEVQPPQLPLFESFIRFPKPLFYDRGHEERITFGTTNIANDSEEKLVLFYTKMYTSTAWLHDQYLYKKGKHYVVANNPLLKCPYRCAYTYDKSLIANASAVLFSILDSMYHKENPQYPLKRYPHQYWISSVYETSAHHSTKKVTVPFNWTASYRLDSDVYDPYGYFYKREKSLNLDSINIPSSSVLRKKKLVAALVSNCRPPQRRKLIEQIAKYIPVDIYGKCGTLKCPEPDENNKKDCKKYLGSKYKFFLAFENSLCQDYITEKFFTTFHNEMVPVTLGLGNYSQVAPPHSFINVLDFSTVKNLTDYLLFLNDNDEEYQKYFHWQQEYGLGENSEFERFCYLCSKLWKPGVYNSTLSSFPHFQEWWAHKRIESNYVSEEEESSKSFQLLNSSKSACVYPRLIIFPKEKSKKV